MKETLIQLIREKAPQRVAEELVGRLEDAVALEVAPQEDESIPVGASKFGGLPDLPTGVEWPLRHGNPLDFIGQFNLAEVAPYDLQKRLPATGMLYFFYGLDEMTGGYDPAHRGNWRVIYRADATELSRTIIPLRGKEPTPLKSGRVTFCQTWTLPNAIEAFELTDEEAEQFWELQDELDALRGERPLHQLLGYAEEVQGDMTFECQLVSHGIYCGTPAGYRTEQACQLKTGAGRWRLLLQVDSDNSLGWMWGDMGRLYYWITAEDLQNRNFEDVWLILQCY